MANLPADLPEDWTQSQFISPNGTEVGLTPQHGYNYLMQQVNAAQTAINNITAEISGALEGVAQETTSQSILTDTQEIISTLGGGTEQSVTEMLQTLLNSPLVIKSIQYGVTTFSGATDAATDITIGTVNPQKCFVLLNGSAIAARNNEDAVTTYDPYISSFTSTSISIKRSSYYSNQSFGNDGTVSYQIIEYV